MERTYENRFADQIVTDQDLTLNFERHSRGTLVLFLEGEKEEVRLHLDAKENSGAKIFIQNRMDHAVKVVMTSNVAHDARVECGLLDLQDHPCKLELQGHLNEQGATMDFSMAQLCLSDQEKKSKLDITSHVSHTYGNMHNFAVVFDGGQYEMVASGRIVKGAYASESHQETRVLTMGDNHKCVTLPILYIDEDDVKASHALSVGQPDAEQLYYLNSRGLTMRQAIGLLSVGYFKPILELIEDEELKARIEQETEERVGMYEH